MSLRKRPKRQFLVTIVVFSHVALLFHITLLFTFHMQQLFSAVNNQQQLNSLRIGYAFVVTLELFQCLKKVKPEQKTKYIKIYALHQRLKN